MQITCINCKQTWEVYAGHLLVARIRFGLGFVEHTFICPNCQAKNVIPATEFEASDTTRYSGGTCSASSRKRRCQRADKPGTRSAAYLAADARGCPRARSAASA
jgi:hypothetical protein